MYILGSTQVRIVESGVTKESCNSGDGRLFGGKGHTYDLIFKGATVSQFQVPEKADSCQ
jgi:hypothetical protein